MAPKKSVAAKRKSAASAKKKAPARSAPKQKRAALKETPEARKKRARKILDQLERDFPGAGTALEHQNALQLLVATILSAQCTDDRVNIVCKTLFPKFRTAADFARVDQAVLEQEIRSTGFYRNKAKNIIGCCTALMERHGGEVPATMEELVVLPGVGRKTANVVLGQVFGKAEGVVVDTHVFRLAGRMGLSEGNTAEKVEEDLMGIYPRDRWISIGNVFILHGRKTCDARKPECALCSVKKLCPSADLFLSSRA